MENKERDSLVSPVLVIHNNFTLLALLF